MRFNQDFMVICGRNLDKLMVYERISNLGLGFDVEKKNDDLGWIWRCLMWVCDE